MGNRAYREIFTQENLSKDLFIKKSGKKFSPFFQKFGLLDIDYVDNYPGIFIKWYPEK